MLSLMSRWFEPISEDRHCGRSHYIALGAILLMGLVLRVWGLGNVGLYHDERHMAPPAAAILETGHPILPSGMYYPRALPQLYIMAGSAWLFGESEWSWRLPSAVVGSLVGLVAFFMGRRFLPPKFNLAFVATMTLLPAMVEASQMARMYVFLVFLLIWFAACLFRWERDQRLTSLVLAFVVWVFALLTHTLAVFAAPLFLFPGLSRASTRQAIQGGFAFVAAALTFKAFENWASRHWFPDLERPLSVDEVESVQPLAVLTSGNDWLLAAVAVLGAVAVILLVLKSIKTQQITTIVPVAVVVAGLVALSFLHYHAGLIILGVGAVFWLRSPLLSRRWLLVALGLAVAICLVQVLILKSTGLYPGRKIIGALIGWPSVWPTLRFLEFSPVAGVLYAVALLAALARFARGWSLPVHFLFFAIAVWLPLLMIGHFAWYIPPRYAQGQLGYFLLCVFAGLVFLAREWKWLGNKMSSPRSATVALVLVTVLLVNPFALARAVYPGYDTHPDHKGAAEYIKSVDPELRSVIIAEDVILQQYYLGRADYWLREYSDVISYARLQDGRMHDVYTWSEILSTGAELEAVLDSASDRDVFIIGSGDNFRNGVARFRGYGIAEVLESDRLEVVYHGRDGKTLVWKLRRP
jgi:hypothetical protein